MTPENARDFVKNNYGNLPNFDMFFGMFPAHLLLGLVPLGWSFMSGLWWASIPYWVAAVVCVVTMVVVRARPAAISYRQTFLQAGLLGVGDSLFFLLFCTSSLQCFFPHTFVPCAWLVGVWLATIAVLVGGARHWARRGIYAQASLPRPIRIMLLPLAAGLLGGGGSWVLAYPQSSDITPIFVGVAFFFFVSAIFLLAAPHLLRAHYIKKFSISGPSGLAYTPTAPGQRPLPLRLLIGLEKFLLKALLWIVAIILLVYAMYYILLFFGEIPSRS